MVSVKSKVNEHAIFKFQSGGNFSYQKDWRHGALSALRVLLRSAIGRHRNIQFIGLAYLQLFGCRDRVYVLSIQGLAEASFRTPREHSGLS